MKLELPAYSYMHGWVQACANARRTEYCWNITIHDVRGQPTTFSFDLVKGHSPLIIGLDSKKSADTLNRCSPSGVVFQRPCDSTPREYLTYIAPDESRCERLRLDIVPHPMSSASSLLANVVKRHDLNITKKIHRYTHATVEKMKRIIKDGGMATPELNAACEKVFQVCQICVSSGRPGIKPKISLSHVNTRFNDEVQADFVTVYIREEKYEVLNVIDSGTRYGERVIATSRDSKSMMSLFETEWLYHHGAPTAFSADPEFCKPFFHDFLKSHKIEARPRPSRSSWKNGIVERNNGTFKNVLSRIARENTSASPTTLIARASLMKNMFHGNATLSAFQLAHGYVPSIAGVPDSLVSQELLDAHVEIMASRAIQRVLQSKQPNLLQREALSSGTKIWVYFNTSKQNDPERWLQATVVEAGEHQVKCRRSRRGPPMCVAYNHIRLVPTGELAQELMEGTLEGVMAKDDEVEVSGDLPNDVWRDIFGEERDPELDVRARKVSSMLSRPVIGDPTQEIGKDIVSGPALEDGEHEDLESCEQDELDKLYKAIGSEQVSYGKMSLAPAWLIEKAVREELTSNWNDAYVEVPEASVTSDANVVTSHFVFKIKVEEHGRKRLKARLCPHGNRNPMKIEIRRDSSTAQFDVIRLLMSLAVLLRFTIGWIDIKGAFLQSGPIKRLLYVRPPRRWVSTRGMLWRLTKLPYGIGEAGRQWAKTFESWMLEEAGLERVFGVGQMYVRRGQSGRIVFILAKVTDDFLM